MNQRKQQKETLESKHINNKANNLGLDPDEQEMNGLYGMVETEYEDSLPHSNSKEKR